MPHTGITIGGFIQPNVARSLIELQANVEKGLCQRFLWLCPKASFVKFDQLQQIDDTFSTAVGTFQIVVLDFRSHSCCFSSPDE